MTASTRWLRATVQRVRAQRPGLQQLDCLPNYETAAAPIPGDPDPGAAPLPSPPADIGHPSDPAPIPALAYTDLVGTYRPGDEVILNTAALDARLGTGGWAFVVAPGSPVPQDRPTAEDGYLVKARYTPLQVLTRGVDEQTSPHHGLLQDATDIWAMPVVVADLHSQLPAITAAITHDAPGLKVAYVMTDGGALPIAFSDTVAQLKAAGQLHTTITVGQAFGGDYEAVTVHTALLAARLVARCDIAVVAQGPGNLGTDTMWGFSGVAAGEAINATALLSGRPVAALRVSQADPRARHRGISHHSLTAYGRVARFAADLPLPVLTGRLAPFGQRLSEEAGALVKPAGPHRRRDVPVDGLMEALRESPVRLSTMGRSLDDDPAAFLASAAAGRWAATLAQGRA